ncbi:MAG: transglycosylase domain-containing protein [Bacteroidetes bacterium]|nr:transglycosylase domain-containing protein [Bacteroidota bacterium]
MFDNQRTHGVYESRKKQRRFKWLKITAISFVGIFVILFSIFLIFKNDFLSWAISKVQHKIHEKYHTTLTIKGYTIKGFSTVELNNLSLKPQGVDTLLNINKIEASVKLLPLFLGKIRLSSLNINGASVSLIKYDSTESNFKNFLSSDKQEKSAESEKNVAKSAYKFINKLMAQIPSDFELNNCNISFKNVEKTYSLLFSKATLNSEELNANWGIHTPSDTQSFVVKGTFSPSDMTANVKIHSANRSKMYMPIVDEKFNLDLGADEVELKLDEVDYSGSELHIKCFASYKNLLINHKRLADHDIKVSNGLGNFHFILGENFISLDSSSNVMINKISVSPYFRYQVSPFKTYSLKLHTPRMLAQDFFNSLPDGMFESLNGIQTDGYLSYNMFCELNDTCPREVQFDSELKPENFRVRAWGNAYLPKLNSSFTYTPFEYGRPQRTIEVGESNPNFTPIDQISPYLKNAVLSSEDPSFYSHRGFVMESIRGSIAQNYISKRFARGASTISMQLVKNIFLSRQKTMTRKFEEMLLVWLIENNHVASKQRMFEVYLNIIEWGPNVYGIGEASNFYFNKTASDMTLPEAIYLSANRSFSLCNKFYMA